MTAVHDVRTVPTDDGRELEVLVAGAADGFPLVFHHWTPGSAVPFPFLEAAAAERGLRLVSYSRPGYGSSTPRADAGSDARVADDANDVAAILTHLGLGDFVTVGWSGGGMRPLACAATLPDRCRAAACLACPVPHGVEGLDPYAGMTPENVKEYEVGQQGSGALTSHLEGFLAPFLEATDEQAADALRGMFGPALSGELGDYALACMRHSVEQGVVGWRDDTLTHSRPWGFDLGRIDVPVSVWHGTEDQNVSSAHGVWLGEHIPTAEAHLVDGDDHISIILRMGEVLDDLVARARLNPPVTATTGG